MGTRDSALHPRGITGHQHRALGWRLGRDSHWIQLEEREKVTAPPGLHPQEQPRSECVNPWRQHIPSPHFILTETRPKENVPDMSPNPPVSQSQQTTDWSNSCLCACPASTVCGNTAGENPFKWDFSPLGLSPPVQIYLKRR